MTTLSDAVNGEKIFLITSQIRTGQVIVLYAIIRVSLIRNNPCTHSLCSNMCTDHVMG